jgi:hypothetical protein
MTRLQAVLNYRGGRPPEISDLSQPADFTCRPQFPERPMIAMDENSYDHFSLG